MQKFFSLLVKWPIFMGDKIEENLSEILVLG